MAPVLDANRHRREQIRKIAACHVLLLAAAQDLLRIENERKRIRRWYVRPINMSRPLSSEFASLVRDFYELDDAESHRQYFRMDREQLYELYEMVRTSLEHPPTHARPITPALRLSMSLKVLASGDSMANTAKAYRIGNKTAFNILYETCEAIWNNLQPRFLKFPETEDEWKSIAEHFWIKWQFPLCLGAIDGKHVTIKKPAKAGSRFFNYKYDNSIVLLAVADAQYRFIYVDIGGYGRNSDGGILAHSSFGRALVEEATNELRLPGFGVLPGTDIAVPHVFIGDDAFAIGPHMLKPYGGTKRDQEQRCFDYRLSRARRVIENTFGIMTSRFRILHQALGCEPENAEKIVKAVVVLHNFLLSSDEAKPAENRYAPPRLLDYADASGEIRDGAWRHFAPPDAAFRKVKTSSSKNAYGKRVRDRFKDYFQTVDGQVPWQNDRLG